MCPVGTDQTERSPQQWHLLTPKLRQRQDMPVERDYHHESIAMVIAGNTSFGAFEKLVVPASPVTLDSHFASEIVGLPSMSKQTSPIENLPVELFNMVLDQLELSKQDKMALACCSQLTWTSVRQYILTDCRRNSLTWAGTPLVCTGTWLTELSPALYEAFPSVKEEEERLATPGSPFHYGMAPARRWNWDAVSTFQEADRRDIQGQWMDALKAVHLDNDLLHQLKQDLGSALRASKGLQTTKWILRNLSIYEIIFVDASAGDGSKVQAFLSGSSQLTLDTALLTKICWGSRDYYNPNARLESLAQGSWAGHCFDIVPANSLQDVDSWKDVTRDTAKKLRSVLESVNRKSAPSELSK